MTVTRRTFLIASASALLSACGGAGKVPIPAPAPTPKRVVELYGESTFNGYGLLAGQGIADVLQQLLPEHRIINRAVNSTTAQQQFEGRDGLNLPWLQQMQQSPADIVVLNRGINDAYRDVPVADFETVMQALVQQAKQCGKQVILQTPNMVEGELQNALQPNVEILRQMAERLRVPLSDAQAFGLQTIDGTHQTAALAQAMAESIAHYIRSLS